MPKAFLMTHKRYNLYNLNIPRLWKNEDENKNERDQDYCDRDRESDRELFIGRRIKKKQPWPWVEIDKEIFKTKIVRSESPKIKVGNLIEAEINPCNERNLLSNCNRGQLSSFDGSGQENDLEDVDEEQPVNLSIKKIDLFNLTQLAEVSLATAGAGSSIGSGESSTSDSCGSCEPETASPEKIEADEDESLCSVVRQQICSECGKGFSTLSNLARHRQTHRSTADSSAAKKCPHCDKVYVSIPAFSMHLRTHNQGCKCPYCGKGFSRPWLLQGHIRTHTGEKPFKCNICGKAFADKSNLRAHTQTHSMEKPFICSRCGKTFALKSYLCKHIESSCMRTNRGHGMSVSSTASTVGDQICKMDETSSGSDNGNSLPSPSTARSSLLSSPPPLIRIRSHS